jgi:hypothetical protein
MSRRWFPLTVLLIFQILLCLGCAGPALTSRVMHQDSSSCVRLDSYQGDTGSSAHYEHPVTWTAEELFAILSRLLLVDRIGLMDSPRPPRPVFSAEETRWLVPVLRDAFHRAMPSEWIAFSFSAPDGSEKVVTSGGMFLAGARLHVILANHRTPLAGDSEERARVRANPLHSVKGSGGALTFESARYVMGTQANWSGGHKASASELILDHQGFLLSLKLHGPVPLPVQNAGSSDPALTSEPTMLQTGSPGSADSDLTSTILRLQEEVARLKQKVLEQETEIGRLKDRSTRSLDSTTHP